MSPDRLHPKRVEGVNALRISLVALLLTTCTEPPRALTTFQIIDCKSSNLKSGSVTVNLKDQESFVIDATDTVINPIVTRNGDRLDVEANGTFSAVDLNTVVVRLSSGDIYTASMGSLDGAEERNVTVHGSC